jgi:hypothetical protein
MANQATLASLSLQQSTTAPSFASRNHNPAVRGDPMSFLSPRRTTSFRSLVVDNDDSWAVVVHPLDQKSYDRKGLLELKRGEKVQILAQCSDIWWMGRKENGEEGYFPLSFVRQIGKNTNWNESGLLDLYFESKSVPAPPENVIEYEVYVTVLWDFIKVGKEEISLRADSEAKVLGSFEQGFYKVRFGDEEGVIQSDYCSKIKLRRKV